MGGSNKEHTLLDSIRNGDSQTAIKILQNSMINTNKSQSFIKARLLNHKLKQNHNIDLTSSSLTTINTSSIKLFFWNNFRIILNFNQSGNRSLSVDCNSNMNYNNSLRVNNKTEIIELNRIQSTSNSNLNINNTNKQQRKKHANKLFDIKSLNTNNKLITKVFQYYDGNNNNLYYTLDCCMFDVLIDVFVFKY